MQTYDCVCVRFDDAFRTPSSSDQMRTLLLLPLHHFPLCGIHQADREHPFPMPSEEMLGCPVVSLGEEEGAYEWRTS